MQFQYAGVGGRLWPPQWFDPTGFENVPLQCTNGPSFKLYNSQHQTSSFIYLHISDMHISVFLFFRIKIFIFLSKWICLSKNALIQILTCIFLSFRLKLLLSFHYKTPCSYLRHFLNIKTMPIFKNSKTDAQSVRFWEPAVCTAFQRERLLSLWIVWHHQQNKQEKKEYLYLKVRKK